jgi:2,3-bisphosphoglycerate-independent phosphoglycerate mutase
MDRDNNWDRIAKAEQALFSCKGRICKKKKPSQVIEELHKEGILDEHLEPLVFLDDTGRGYALSKNDALIFFNFRPDRARQLTKKILEKKKELNLCVATMTEYDKNLPGTLVLFPTQPPQVTLAGEVSRAGLRQGHAAETEKYAHVTYFFNGGREEPYPGEERVMIESRRDILTHDLAPEMKAMEVTDAAIKFMESNLDLVVINYANADMVGHSGNVEPTLKAVETLDKEMERLVDAADQNGYVVAITADHGNAELNFDESVGQKHTAHTTSPVPLIITEQNLKLKGHGSLADVAPTVLELMKLPKPAAMTGSSLIA